jgi:hypothetical protein
MSDPQSAPTPGPKEGSPLAAVAVAVAILGAGALLVFAPSKEDGGGKPVDLSPRADGADEHGAGARAPQIAARTYDEAKAAPQGVRLNPALGKLPGGMAPTIPSNDPPAFADKAEELAWYRKRLEAAQSNLTFRRTAAERTEARESKLGEAPDPAAARQQWENTRRIVRDNLARAEAEVAELQKKVAELGG